MHVLRIEFPRGGGGTSIYTSTGCAALVGVLFALRKCRSQGIIFVFTTKMYLSGCTFLNEGFSDDYFLIPYLPYTVGEVYFQIYFYVFPDLNT